MADIDGRDALEMILDRMDDKIEKLARVERERDDARRELTSTMRQVEELRRELGIEKSRPKLPIAPRPADDDIEF